MRLIEYKRNSNFEILIIITPKQVVVNMYRYSVFMNLRKKNIKITHSHRNAPRVCNGAFLLRQIFQR